MARGAKVLGTLATKFASPSDVYWWRAKMRATPIVGDLHNRLHSKSFLSRLDSRTAIVIDGFPRSGNSYFRETFRYANFGAGVVSHWHSPRALNAGLRHGLPTIGLVREPTKAVRSNLCFGADLRVEPIVRSWILYYRSMWDLRDEVLLVDFRDAVERPGEVTAWCNSRFGSNFRQYVSTPESEQQVWRGVDSLAISLFGDSADRVVAKPDATRLAALSQRMEDLTPLERELLAEAADLYRELGPSISASAPLPSGFEWGSQRPIRHAAV